MTGRASRTWIAVLAAGLLGGCGPGSGAGAQGTTATGPPAITTARSAPPPRRAPRPLLVATLGDSITAGSPAWDPNRTIRRALSVPPNPRSQYQYWARRRLGGRVRFRNCGVSGETTPSIALRLDRCVAGARALIVQGGINDIARDNSIQSAADNLEGMVREGRRRRLRVALVEVLPWNNGYPDAADEILALNRLIAAVARRQRVKLIRWYEVLEDPNAPGRMRRQLTSDGDHPSVAGYRRLGEAVVLP